MIYDAITPISVTVYFDATRAQSLPIQDAPEKLGQLVYDWRMRLDQYSAYNCFHPFVYLYAPLSH